MWRPVRFTPRRDAGLHGFERVLEAAGFGPVAGVDEAGRGACAGPLVVGAVILASGRRGRIDGLADSKLLTARRRDEIYAEIVERAAAWSAVVISCHEIDRIGLHRCNIAGMRRALAALRLRPAYVLSDGFRVPGLEVPGLAMPKGDQVAACIAAASVVAKVTRDRLMTELHAEHPHYGFDVHKGYATRRHSAALAAHGPCPEHRMSFVNVARLQAGRLTEVLAPALGSGAIEGGDGRPVEQTAAPVADVSAEAFVPAGMRDNDAQGRPDAGRRSEVRAQVSVWSGPNGEGLSA